jgi:hypothetical protein
MVSGKMFFPNHTHLFVMDAFLLAQAYDIPTLCTPEELLLGEKRL